jgi:lipid A disaccharide synthetase
MGFEVLKTFLPFEFYKNAKRYCRFKPDVIIFIDYPGFNMRIAKWAKEHPNTYYISPNMGLEEKYH